MADKFSSHSDSLSAPARQMFVITPHDSNQVLPLPKALRADTDGSVTLRAVDSAQDVTISVVAGDRLDVRARYVRAAGTTAILHGFA